MVELPIAAHSTAEHRSACFVGPSETTEVDVPSMLQNVFTEGHASQLSPRRWGITARVKVRLYLPHISVPLSSLKPSTRYVPG